MASVRHPDELRVVAAAILRQDTVLVARRGPGMALPLRWELPGGKVEPGETDEAALAREIREELLVEVAVGARIGENLHRQGARAIRLVAYRCRILGGVPRATEHAEVRWVTAPDLAGLDWAPADVPLLDALVRVLRYSPGPGC